MEHTINFSTGRMIKFMRFVVDNRIQGITSEQSFLRSIGMVSAKNISNIKAGTQSFQMKHFMSACEIYHADANYFLRDAHRIMFRRVLPKRQKKVNV